MEALLGRQIHESCKLALPTGLTELMSDISREVLRTQPRNLYQFITDYLAAMLVTRDNLSIAAKVCNEVCKGPCSAELNDELRDIGLDEEVIETVLEVVDEYFKRGEVSEDNLLMKLIIKTDLGEEILPAVQNIVRNAFMYQQANQADFLETPFMNAKDDISRAVNHTLELYKKTQPSKETYIKMTERIQASYRAYGVRRQCSSDFDKPSEDAKEIKKRVVLDIEIFTHVWDRHSKKNLTSLHQFQQTPPDFTRNFLVSVSSMSLAGSYLHLPKYKPYSSHEPDAILESESTFESEEQPDRIQVNIDYDNDDPDDESESYETFVEYPHDQNIKHEIRDVNTKENTVGEIVSNVSVKSEENIIEEVTEEELSESLDENELSSDDEIDEENIKTADSEKEESFHYTEEDVEEVLSYIIEPEN